jgi:general secretion pathway protein D
VKTILPILLLTSLGLAAQTPPPPAPPVPTLPTAPAAPAMNPAPATPTAPGAPVSPPPATAPEDQTIPPGHINWVGADLNNQVLPIYADMVGRSILRPASLPTATLFFRNQTALTKQESIQAIDAVLALNGIAMINVGDKFVKAVPIAQANMEGAPFSQVAAGQLPEMGQYVTHIVQLKYVKPSEMVAALTPFQKLPNAILPIETSQMLVLRDNAENVKRMLEMIEKVDVTVPSEFISEVIPIKFAKVEDIASALNSLSGGGGGGTSIGTRTGTGATGGAHGGTTGARPGQQGYNPNSPMSSRTMNPQTGTTTGTPSGGGSFSDRIRNIISKASSATGSGELQIIGVTKIVADARSNSLLIFATRQDMEMIKDIVNKLDVVLAQVLIETIIMDVSMDDSWKLGLSAVQTPKQLSDNVAGAGGMNANKFFDWTGQDATNSIGQLVGSGFRYFGKVNDNYYVTLEAAASDGRINVIQKPRVQTSHATPASIFIGNTVPYVSGTYYGGGSYGNSSSYQQLSVGIGLNVTPFINSDGLVVMQIDETIDEISGFSSIDGNNVPNTTSRTISAEVAVRDGETIILGGFIRNSNNKSKSGVPILKDIPLLGYLFRSTSDSKERKELIVLMRPTVLRTPELAALQVDKEKERLPGVLQAEQEINEFELNAVKQRKADKKKYDAAHDEPAPSAPAKSAIQGSGSPAAQRPLFEPAKSETKVPEPQNAQRQKAEKQKEQHDDFNKVRPFTPEEEKLYGNPAPVKP